MLTIHSQPLRFMIVIIFLDQDFRSSYSGYLLLFIKMFYIELQDLNSRTIYIFVLCII